MCIRTESLNCREDLRRNFLSRNVFSLHDYPIYIYIYYIYIYIYIYIYVCIDEHNVCSVTSEPSQSGSRRVSSFKDSSALLNN